MATFGISEDEGRSRGERVILVSTDRSGHTITKPKEKQHHQTSKRFSQQQYDSTVNL